MPLKCNWFWHPWQQQLLLTFSFFWTAAVKKWDSKATEHDVSGAVADHWNMLLEDLVVEDTTPKISARLKSVFKLLKEENWSITCMSVFFFLFVFFNFSIKVYKCCLHDQPRLKKGSSSLGICSVHLFHFMSTLNHWTFSFLISNNKRAYWTSKQLYVYICDCVNLNYFQLSNVSVELLKKLVFGGYKLLAVTV